MTTVAGELEYQDIFGISYEPQESASDTLYSNRNIAFPSTANFVWILFLIIIPILLSNMLVSKQLISVFLYIYTLLLKDWSGSWGCKRDTR